MSGVLPLTATRDRIVGADRYGPGKRVSRLRLEDKVIKGDLDLRGMTIKNECQLFNVVVEGDLRADEARFLGSFEARRLTVRGRVQFYSCQFGGLVRLDEAVFKRGARFAGSRFESELVLEGLKINGGDLDLNDCEVAAGLELERAQIHGDLRLEHAQLGGWVDMSEYQGRNLHAKRARFASGLELRSAHFGGSIDLSDVEVQGDVSARGASLGARLDLRRSVFENRVDLVRLECRDVFLDGAQFSKELCLSAVEARRLQAVEAQVLGALKLEEARLSADLNLQGAHLLELDLSQSRVGGDLRAKSLQVSTWMAEGMSVEGDVLASGLQAQWLRFQGLRVEGDARFEGALVTQLLDLRKTVFERRLDIRFDNSPLRCMLQDARAAYPNLRYRDFAERFCDDPFEAAQSCLVLRDWLKIQNQYEDMDRASFLLRTLQRQERATHFLGFIPAFFEWLLVALPTGYGLRPWRIVVTMLALTLALAGLYWIELEAFISTQGSISFADTLRFSLARFVGQDLPGLQLRPGHWIESVALAQKALGVFLTALFVGTLTRKLAR